MANIFASNLHPSYSSLILQYIQPIYIYKSNTLTSGYIHAYLHTAISDTCNRYKNYI